MQNTKVYVLYRILILFCLKIDQDQFKNQVNRFLNSNSWFLDRIEANNKQNHLRKNARKRNLSKDEGKKSFERIRSTELKPKISDSLANF